MPLRKLHYYSAIIISVFIVLHLFNHAASLISIEKHIEVMDTFRKIYRNPFAEMLLLVAVIFQVFSGIRLFGIRRKTTTGFFEKLQLWSGLYLAIFFLIHVSAVMAGRFILQLDTNFYFGAAGLNRFPFNLFFIPYYALAIFSFFAHIASVHYKKMKARNMNATLQARVIILIGIIVAFVLIYGLTNEFKGIVIPDGYKVLVNE
jgi:hypothetical protein